MIIISGVSRSLFVAQVVHFSIFLACTMNSNFSMVGSDQLTGGFAVLGLLFSFAAFFIYIRDILKLRTYPQRASWLIWSTLSLIVFWTQIAEGATTSLWFIGAQFACTFSVFMLSIRYGSGSYLSHRNLTIFATAGFGLFLWYVLDNAAYTLAVIIAINAIGGYATVTKAFRAPESETLSCWVLLVVASVCGIASVDVLDWMYIAYPAYLFGLYCSIVVAIMLGRSRPVFVSGARPITDVVIANPLNSENV